MSVPVPICSVAEARRAAQTGSMEDLIEARSYAERLGAAALHSRHPRPPVEFDEVEVLRDGFFAGYDDARCGAACVVRAGLA